LLNYRESSILEYCGIYYGTQRGGLETLYLYLKPHEFSDFEEELDEDVGGHGYREEEKISDTDDEKMKDTLIVPTLQEVVLRTKQLLEMIQEESISRRILLI
jgi:hypothetical protein